MRVRSGRGPMTPPSISQRGPSSDRIPIASQNEDDAPHDRVDRALPSNRLSNPATLTRLMGAYIVVAVGRVGDFLPWLHEIPLAKVVVVLAIMAAFRLRKDRISATWKSIPPARLSIFVMGLIAVSILFSVLRSATFGIITGTVLAVVITLILTIQASRNWTSVKTILHGAVFASVVLVATLLTSKINDAGGARAGYSNSYDPNDFAFVLVGLLPLVITFGIIFRGWRRLLYFGIACRNDYSNPSHRITRRISRIDIRHHCNDVRAAHRMARQVAVSDL